MMLRRSVSILFRIGISLCFVALLTSAHAGEGKPVAVMASEAFDFGEVFEGTDVTHDFVIKNTGEADLEIQSVKAG